MQNDNDHFLPLLNMLFPFFSVKIHSNALGHCEVFVQNVDNRNPYRVTPKETFYDLIVVIQNAHVIISQLKLGFH